MSIGNTNDSGNKGSNFPYQRSVLKLLSDIACSSLVPACCPTAATEVTLAAILASLQAGKEFEQNLVQDLGGVGCPANCPTYLQIRIFDTDTGTFGAPIYYDASGAVVIPVGPLELVNPQFVLNNILTQITAINADLDVALSTRASEATLLTLATEATVLTLATEATLLTVATEATLLTLATEATLSSLNSKFTSVTRTPSLTRVTGAGAATVPAGARSVSVYNAGVTDGSWLGATIKQGEQFNYSADGEDDVLAAFAYDALTTELVIATII